MAQDDLDFQSILEELRKADEIEKQNAQIQEELEEHSASIDSLEDQTAELLEAAGLEEDDKERNVIGKDKLTATLTSSEKKRYQNIGKEFIDGAGKEFQRILKASKFKNMMSAVKEKFTAGIAKMKRAIKKAKKASGFLAKLLLIIGLLGGIFYLFKDKITSAIPNITQFVKDIFQKAKDFLGGLVEKAFTFFTGGNLISAGLGVVIGYFKDAIRIFFGQTLPDAIYELYLNVLSMFSSDAEDLKEEFASHPANQPVQEQAVSIANDANDEAESGVQLEEGIAASQRVVEEAGQNLNNLTTTQLTNLQSASSTAQFHGLDANSPLVQQLNDLADGDADIMQMINDGQVDTRHLFSQIREASKDGELSRQEAFEALRSSIMDEEMQRNMQLRQITEGMQNQQQNGQPQITIDGEPIASANGSPVTTIANNAANQAESQTAAFEAITQAAIADGRRQDEINAQLNARQQRQQSQQRETSITANEVQLESYKRVTLNAQNAISDTLKEAFLDLSTAIKNFLSADDLTKSLTAGITVLNANFVTFFDEIRKYATDMLKNLADVAQSSFTFYNKLVGLLDAQGEAVRQAQQASAEEAAAQAEGERRLREFAINVNVDMGGDRPHTQFEFLKDVISIDTTLSRTLEQTNTKLASIATKIQSGALNRTGDLTVNEEIERVIKNNITQTFNQNRLSIVNNVVNNVIADARMMGAITEKLTDEGGFVDKIAKHITEETDGVNRIVNTITTNNTILNTITDKTSRNETFIKKTTEIFTGDSRMRGRLTDAISKGIREDSGTMAVIERQVVQGIAPTISNRIMNNQQTVINSVVTNLSQNETIISNVNEKITNLFRDETTINSITQNLINNPEYMTQFVTNVTQQVINDIKDNHVELNEGDVTNVVQQVMQQVETHILNNIENYTNVKVDNRVTNTGSQTSIVTLVDKDGEENTLELVDRRVHEAAINALRADIRTLANATATNRQQINNNTVQVSKLVGIGNMSVGASDPLPVQPLYALSV